MSDLIDLRRFNIKDVDDAIAFLELVEARVPQVIRIIKRHQITVQSLINRAEHAEAQIPTATASVDGSVGDRLVGKVPVTSPANTQQADRLAQMLQAAKNPDAGAAVNTPSNTPDAPLEEETSMATPETDDPLDLTASPAPGEIGHLDVPSAPASEQGSPASTTPDTPANSAPSSDNAIDQGQAAFEAAMGEAAADSGTSKSERVADGGIQPQNPTAEDGEVPAEQAVATPAPKPKRKK